MSKQTGLFGDGTYNFAPKCLLELYTLHTYYYVNGFYVPIAYCTYINWQININFFLFLILSRQIINEININK